jgi:DNA end-binding protein Ku
MASAATLPLSWDYREVLEMASRPVGNGNISFGLVSIPVRLFPATRSKAVSFNLLHAKDQSRIQQKIFCPVDDAIIDRSELVRGYEVAKGRYVTFTDEELKALETHGGDHSIEITEFVPLEQIDPIYFETSYYLGCEQASAKAYRLLTDAMTKTGRVALGRFTLRGKEHVVVLRPYEKGLMMHTVYYADEVRPIEEIDRATNEATKENELALAERLIAELTSQKIDLSRYHDTFREKVEEAAQQKIAGQQVTEAHEEPRRGQVIDLMAALKASLEKRGATGAARAEERAPEQAAEAAGESADEAETAKATGTGGGKAHARARHAGSGERRRAGGKK